MSVIIIEKYRDIAAEIFKSMGTGHTEFIYHRALEIELQLKHIIYESEKRVLITYEKAGNKYTLGEERIDLYIPEENLIIELKAITNPPKESEIAQLKKYHRELGKMGVIATRGIIINFPQPGVKQAKDEIDFIVVEF